MQQAAMADGGARAPKAGWSTDVYRRRPGLLRETGTEFVSVGGKGGLLELAASARRHPWTLPHFDTGLRPNRRGEAELRWPWRVSPHLVLVFLGWLVEGGLAPTKRGKLVAWAHNRWIFGSRANWAELVGCHVRTFSRMVAELAELGLVEQQRLVVDKSRRRCREVPAAYRPGPALFAWLAGAPPALLEGRTRFPSSGALPRSSNGGKDGVDPPEAGHGCARAEPEGLAPESGPTAKAEPEAVGTVAVASAAAPVGDERPAEGPQLLVAGVSARPAAPPAEKPPGDFVAPSEVAALARTLVGQLELGIPEPPADELEAHRRRCHAQLARMRRRDGSPGAGGAS